MKSTKQASLVQSLRSSAARSLKPALYFTMVKTGGAACAGTGYTTGARLMSEGVCCVGEEGR
jgi:hypothetical protein